MSKEQVIVTADQDFQLTLHQETGNRERIGIKGEYPKTEATIEIFRSLALMYLISPHLPEKISTDFYVPDAFRELIGSMYQCEGHEKPIFSLLDPKNIKYSEPKFVDQTETSTDKSVLTYSGGKDTLWNLDWLAREKGINNVLGVHFKRINLAVSGEELKATTRQQKQIGFPLKIVDLLNSTQNSGKKIMRARDIFIVGLSVPYAQAFGASTIVLEGDFYKDHSVKNEPFTCYESSWKLFNDTLASLGIPVKADWRDSNGMNTIRDLVNNRPEWIPLIHNCFSPECYKPERRRKWAKVAPSFPLFESQCGSCVKCRELNIARIAFDPSVQTAKEEDIVAYIKDTKKWAKEHQNDLVDFLAGAFSEQLNNLAQMYQSQK